MHPARAADPLGPLLPASAVRRPYPGRGPAARTTYGWRPWALAALFAALAGCSLPGRADEPIVLGLVAAPAAPGQVTMRMGAELALKEINAAGGVRGRPLRFEVKDDARDNARAITVAQEFLDDRRVAAVIGHVSSRTTLAAAPLYGRGLPLLAPTASSPLISRLGRWVFRIAASDSASGATLARHAARQGRRIAILYSNDEDGRGLAESFRAALAGAGAPVQESDPFLRTTEDFGPYLERLRRRGAEVVFLSAGDAAAARAIRQAQRLGFRPLFLGGDGLEGLSAEGPDFDGVRVGLPFHPTASPAAARFAAAFRAEYGREPDSYPASGYDAVYLLARALEAVGPRRAAVRDYLDGVGRPGGSPAFAGATGIIRFDANGDPLDRAIVVGVVRQGRIVPVENAR